MLFALFELFEQFFTCTLSSHCTLNPPNFKIQIRLKLVSDWIITRWPEEREKPKSSFAAEDDVINERARAAGVWNKNTEVEQNSEDHLVIFNAFRIHLRFFNTSFWRVCGCSVGKLEVCRVSFTFTFFREQMEMCVDSTDLVHI